jgi:protein phosphatase
MVKRGRSALEAIAPLDPEGLPASSLAPPPLHRALRLLESAVQAAAYMVYGMAEADPEHEGMGTTISVLALAGSYALTAQVGDSRIYLARGGKAEQLTEDHTLVNQQLKSGELTDAEAKWSRQKHLLTRAVGARDYVNVDTRYLLARPGDGFLLCSDGLHAYVDLELVAGFLKVSPELAAKRFIGIANQRGGRDNITAVVVKLE